ncbi:hypothetical protein LTR67_004218 [Exophiala xenobiotica]
MASEDESQTSDHHHDENDWETHKEAFRACYIDQNMTRKDAAQYLRDHFGFDATPRQWERKIKQWDFSKYSSREERLSQIAQTGKTIYEVGRPGRRPRGHTDEHGRLHPPEDRNLRRFARREASRSRSRSRSTSFTERTRPQVHQHFSEPSSSAITDQTFNLHLGNPTAFHPPSKGFTVAAMPAAGQPEQPVQLHLLHEQNSTAFGELEDPDLFLTVDNSHYGSSSGQEQFPVFTDEMMQAGPLGGVHNTNMQFPLDQNLDNSINYPLANQTMNVPTEFDQFDMSGNGLSMNAGLLNNSMMGEQQMFDGAPQINHGANEMGQSILDTIPVLTFDEVETDATTTLPTGSQNVYDEMGDLTGGLTSDALDDSGPLQTDVMPLVEEYTKAVQSAALWFLSSQQYGDTSPEKLAANLDQPGQIFQARMAVMLNNFAMSQQRALQAMRDKCNKLKKKNETLEEFINTSSKLIPALESPARLEAILEALHLSEHEVRTIQFSRAHNIETRTRLLKLASNTHDPGYLHHLLTVYDEWLSAGLIEKTGNVLPECFYLPSSTGKPPRPPQDAFARAGYYAFDMSSGIMSDSYRAIVASANLACEGTDMLTGPSIDTVLALCRPPGHHCDGRRAGGYCYINNAALAASTWRSQMPNANIGILDIDFHHGNGTQEIFYSDPKVLYVSIHGEDEFPYYTGAEDETGLGEADGMNVNLPLKVGSPIEEYMDKLQYGLKRLVDYKTDFLIVSLGFDTFHSDPLGHFQIHTEDYETIARTTRQSLKRVPALILLEGGYVIEHLGKNVLSFLKGWKSA